MSPLFITVNFCYNKKMEKINLKNVSSETRKIIKQQVIQLLKKHVKHKEIADTLNISLQTVDRISSAYKKEGTKCLQEKTRGRKLGEKRQLTPEQENEIRNILIDKAPDQMKLCFMLWTRAAVCQLIREKYNITITLRNMSEYLKRWGMTCQRPTNKENGRICFMHKCIQFHIILKICFFSRTLTGHSPTLQIFAHVAKRNGNVILFPN